MHEHLLIVIMALETMDSAEDAYRSIKDPRNLVQSVKDFHAWLDIADSVHDLECCLKAFEDAELYEYCAIIRDKIKNFKA